ncbi:MAG TPA: response regulator [Spirochaetota bacterium]|nr:response regulator [Spirochaetota bacterium]HOS38193.1 response regulator [Spirochaetota bacterium]HPI23076.1 response regulator [Spirochaetota bacterium]HPU89095.1 response regulator [Spirochaetota bacterium]
MSARMLQAVSVDDERTNLMVVEAMARDLGIAVRSFRDPRAALDFVAGNDIDLAFVDYLMPEMDGVELITRIRAHHADVPVVMITSVEDDNRLKVRAIEAGATEFLTKPLGSAEFRARVRNLVELRTAQLVLRDRAALLEREVRAATAAIRDREYESLIVLARVAEYKDRETAAHIIRVGEYARIIAASLGEPDEVQDVIFNAAPLHDIGKIGIPDAILQKDSGLSAEEVAVMRSHPRIGHGILKDSHSPYLQAGALVSLTHHEKFDGSGYPDGLAGEAIHLYGRIVAVSDVFDALTARRHYKEPWTIDDSLAYLARESGAHFDPRLVEHFVANLDAVLAVRERYAEPAA